MNGPSFLTALLGAVLLAATAAFAPRLGAETLPGPQQVAASGPLDGMAFAGILGPADDFGDGRPDTLYFRNGHFWSEQCVPCGFMPGRYWVHETADGIHFRGELTSPENGTFEYTGVVRDGEISVTADWRKERWYWTIDREFRFEGTLRDGSKSFATLGSAQATAISALESGSGCEPG